MAEPQDIVLSYHDVLIRQNDLRTLEHHNWLNDTIIGFYFDYLEREECQNEAMRIVFASPELTQLLKLIEVDDYSAILNGRITEETDYVFFPLNNSDDRESAGGVHWSLLIYSKSERSCFHLDSSGSFNEAIAKEYSTKIIKFLLQSQKPNFTEVSCPQQNNSYDCGIFVLCFAEIILENIKTKKRIECDLKKVEEEAKTLRGKISKIIIELSKREN